MSTIERDLATDLEEWERLRKLGIDQEDESVCADISEVLERRARDDSRRYDAEGNYTSGATRHGHSRASGRTPEYRVWQGMIERCRNENLPNYGGKGIKVCGRWRLFDNFLADMGPRPEGHTLERIDSDGDYEPSNCRWATYSEQMRNTRRNHNITINKTTKCITDWCKFSGIDVSTVNARLRAGWEPWIAIFCPAMPRGGISRWHPLAMNERQEIALLRVSILTVIDDGDPLDSKPWALWHPFEPVADEARIRFCDAVVEHLRRG